MPAAVTEEEEGCRGAQYHRDAVMATTPDTEKTSAAHKRPLDFKFVVQKLDGSINYEKTWPDLRTKATEHSNRLVLILHHMMHIIALEDEAKRKAHGLGGAAGVANDQLTAAELEKVFGGRQGVAWAPVTGSKGRRYFQEWILRVRELCKSGQVKIKQPDEGAIVHCVIGNTDNDKVLVESLSMRAIDEANNIMCATFVKALGRHRQFDSILTAGTRAAKMIATWKSEGEVPENCIIRGRFRPENVPVVALFREFAAACMQSSSVHQGDLWQAITYRDHLEPLDEAILGMTEASDTLKEKWTRPDHHAIIEEMMATSVIVKVNQMSRVATDARVKHVLWTAWQAMQTNARVGAGTLTMQRLLPAIDALNKQVLDEKLVLPGNKRKAEHIETSSAVAVQQASSCTTIEPEQKRTFTLEDITLAIKAESAKTDARITNAINANVNKKLRSVGVDVKGGRGGHFGQDRGNVARKDQREDVSDERGSRRRGRGRGSRGSHGRGGGHQNGNRGAGAQKGQRECFECGATDGHMARDCPQTVQQRAKNLLEQQLGGTALRSVYFENNTTDSPEGEHYSDFSSVMMFSVPPACDIVVPHPSQNTFDRCGVQVSGLRPATTYLPAAARPAARHPDVETQAHGGASSVGCEQPAVDGARPATRGVVSLDCQRPAGGGAQQHQVQLSLDSSGCQRLGVGGVQSQRDVIWEGSGNLLHIKSLTASQTCSTDQRKSVGGAQPQSKDLGGGN